MARRHSAVHGNPAARHHQNGLAEAQIFGRDDLHGAGSPDRYFTRQEFQKVADGLAPAAGG
ncbi:MAG TPA: hypothetical protein VKU01_11205 [Bryobacteraceae bacterium]|nr:hypothetical protein [Bryobacteraceae bacterium]